MHHDDDPNLGLAGDLTTLFNRRLALGMFGAAGLASLVGCASDGSPGASPTTAGATTGSGTASSTTAASCAEIPEETAGPYPGDGSNGPNVLNQSGIVRSDLRSSFGSASGVAKGVPLTVNLTIVDTSKSCAPYAGAAVYLWHCDMNGLYSMYSQGATRENYLRGVQEANASGLVTFKSIFPAAYSGRWPHIHFEVYATLAKANSSANKISTSQLALPSTICEAVYATAGYEQSVTNMKRTSLGSDNVFRDGYAQQLATVTGSVADGYVANLTVPV
jgi:protocatechuate 3,4-dioxygenase beta subunit